ncbi:MAG: hypothetical protein E6929_19080, partial [Clostridium sp.]|nr:hypothetical protein [Clostridium sp.]
MNRKKIASLILATSIVTTQVATPVFANTNDNNVTEVTSSQDNKKGEVNKNTRSGTIVNIPDPNLKAYLNKLLKQLSTSDITQDQLLSITSLNLSNLGIRSLEGLQYCTNMTGIVANNTPISDLTPLKNLTKFRYLEFDNNEISDLTPLKEIGKKLFVTGSQCRVVNQKITAKPAKLVGNTVTVDNIVKNAVGALVPPIESPDYTYDKFTGKITFHNITSQKEVSYSFKCSPMDLDPTGTWGNRFTGTVTQKVIKNDVDKSGLQQLIDTAKDKVTNGNLTQSSKDELNQAIKKAEGVLNNPDATQNEVNNAITELQNVLANVSKKPDKSALQQLINTAKDKVANGNLTQSSKDELNQAIKKAEGVLNNQNATQTQVNNAITELQNVLANVSQKPDKSGLQQLVNTAKDKVANGNLIPNSIKALNAA